MNVLNPFIKTIALLFTSNVFMTTAWYGHLRFLHQKPLIPVILIAWGIAFFEYCFQVPGNRIGSTVMSAYQLKILQEVITLIVFVIFAKFVLHETMRWNYLVSFLLLAGAAWFAFAFKGSS